MSKVSGIEMFNIIRATLTPQFKERVPEASDMNFREIGAMLTRSEMKVFANEWLSALMNKVSLSLLQTKMLRNRLAPFKKGIMEYGDIIEEIWVEPAKSKKYVGPQLYDDINPGTQCLPNPYCKEKPDVRTQYHRRNREDFYKTTLFRDTLKKAFYSAEGLGRLADAIVESVYNGANEDEYLWMKELFTEYIFNPHIPLAPDQIQFDVDPIVDDASGKAFITRLKSAAELLTFNSQNFNPNRVTTWSDRDSMHLFVKAGITPILDVETMAGAFNPNYLNNPFSVTVVDDFGTLDDGNTIAVLADNTWWMVYDNLREFDTLWNPEGRYWNYWLHVWQTYATSYFANALIFRTEELPAPPTP